MTQSWVNDKYVKNWFELLGNERTIANYRDEFPIFRIREGSDRV